MQINQRFLKISSKIPTILEPNLGEDLTFQIGGQTYIGNVVKIENLDQQDGTMDVVYVVKLLSE